MKFLNTLQVGRGLAALAVVFHHAIISTDAFSGGVPSIIHSFLEFGYLGVDFFFVLSGFIIYYAFIASKPTPKQFLLNRFIRIYAPYLPIGVAITIAYLLLPQLSSSNREWGMLASFTLLPLPSPPALSVAWTLQHELVFYAIFGTLAALGKIKSGMIIWASIIIALWFANFDIPKPLKFFFSPINLEFIFGLFTAVAFISKRKISGVYLIGLSFIIIFFILGAPREFSPIFGAGLACFIFRFANLESRGVITPSKWFIFLGSASYSIYLIHSPLLSVTSRMIENWQLSFTIGVASSILAGSLYYVVIEKPSQRILRHKKPRATHSQK